MKHFKRTINACIFWIVCVSALTAGSLANELWVFAVVLILILLVIYAVISGMVDKLIKTMTAFVEGLEAGDSTLRMPEDSDDRDLRKMQRTANRLLETYRKTRLELETKKLYYDRILTVMTHEMRNTVTPIISISSDMEKNPGKYQGERMSEAAEMICQQGASIKRFLDAYFELTHLPEPEMKNLKLKEFLNNIRYLVKSELESRHLDATAVNFLSVDDVTFRGDAGLLTQVMLNLIRNALDAGGEDVRVEVLATMSEESLIITVSDNGSGVSPDVRANLFEPFFTTKPDGVGVGLFLSRQIARKHGGGLICLNRPEGCGAAFRLTLPAQKDSSSEVYAKINVSVSIE